MSTRLPVIANRIAGTPELVAHEVSGLLTRPERRDLGKLRSRVGRLGREKMPVAFGYRKSAAVRQELFTRELAKGSLA